ncbi:hypothetical protein [Brevibacillus sp. HD3.3A]|uniref:hypothetical protein n=1 Tax=Brevibacillus sp. HD3.3A TaxID=2738979 RepID=UPI00156AE770|nr:hypothetical protein [Brevibacillus sp. HD3.3A]UED72127.1 hypothetical protein HP435_28900 [Brevibacillus sp. HD3.3A]
MKAFENYKVSIENFESVVKVAIETGTDVMLVEEDGEKFLRADYDHAYDKGDIIWCEEAGECARHLAKGEYPDDISGN